MLRPSILSSFGLLSLIICVGRLGHAVPLAFHVVDADPKHPSGVVLPGASGHAVRDSTGRLIVAYTLATQQATQYYNFARTSVDDGATWTSAVRTETMPDSSSSYALAVDASDVLHLGFGFNVGTFVTTSSDHGLTWGNAVQLLDGGWGSWDYAPSLAIDTNGALHAVIQSAFGWSDPPYNVLHAISTDSGATFTTPTAVSQVPNDDAAWDSGAQQPVVVAGATGQLFLVYNLRASAANSKNVLRQWNGTNWGDEIQLSTPTATAVAAYDLAVDANGLVQVAFAETPAGATAPILVLRNYNPQTKALSEPRVISASGDAVGEVTLGVYAENATIVGYSVYSAATSKYGGVKLVRSSDNYATAELVSTHPEAHAPSLRYQANSFHQPAKPDLLWIEVNDTTGGEMLVHAIAGTTPGQVTTPTTPTGYRVEAFGPRIVNPGQDATFLVQYQNGRDEAINDAVVSVSLPLDFPYVRSTHGGQLLASGSAQEVYWRLGTLASKARGFLGVTLRIPWAIPEGTASLTLRAGAQGGIGTIAPETLPTSSPTTVAQTEVLDQSTVMQWLSTDSGVARVVDQAKALGYAGPYSGERSAFASGAQVVRLFMISPDRGSPAIVTSGGKAPYLEAIERGSQVVADATGGYRLSSQDGSFVPFGNWAVTHSPSVARCQLNCTLGKVPGWAVEAASKTASAISTGVDCVICARTKGSDQGACAKCANAYHDVPGVGQAVDVAECLDDCLKDPSKHVCTEDKRECSNSWGATFAGWAGKATVAITYCNKITGTYDPINRDIYCDRGEVCVAGACLSKDEMCGPGAKAGYEDATCSLTPFQVVPAHDPNAKHVVPEGDVLPGAELRYTIEYENVGTGAAVGVFVLDTVSANLNLDSVLAENGASWSRDARLLSWTVGDLAPGAGGQVRFSARVPTDAAIGTAVCNVAEVHFPSAGEITPTNPVCNTVGRVVASAQAVQVVSGAAANLTLNGSSVGAEILEYRVTRTPLHGTLSGTLPQVTYTASDGFVGQDELEFVVAQGVTVSAPARVTFDVKPSPSDVTPPEVVETWPTNASIDTVVDATAVTDGQYLPVITATVSESLDPKSVTAGAMTITGIAGSLAWNAATRTLSLSPAQPLESGTTYQVTLGAPLADYAGNPLKAHQFSFTTAQRRALRVALAPGASSLALQGAPGVQSLPATLGLVSVGRDPVAISSVSIFGQNPEFFQVREGTCAGTSVAPAESCYVSLAAQSPIPGEYKASLVVVSDASNSRIEIPLAYSSVIGTTGTAGMTGAAGMAGSPVGAAGVPAMTTTTGGASAAAEDDESAKTTTTCSCHVVGVDSTPPRMLGLLGLLAIPLLRRHRSRRSHIAS